MERNETVSAVRLLRKVGDAFYFLTIGLLYVLCGDAVPVSVRTSLFLSL